MKAIICSQYGSPDLLTLEDVPQPVTGRDDVLVRVHAASVTYSNLALVTGKPLLVRPVFGLMKPGIRIPGSDIAGRVEAVGDRVTKFSPGDEVFGDLAEYGRGGFAEYVAVPEKALAKKPARLSFAEAAAVPEAALVALQALRDTGKIEKGHKVLITGASGGIGTFAVQIAQYFGAEVTAVCSSTNSDLVRSLGAHHVIDYQREDFTSNGQQYDLILATAGNRSILEYRRALAPGGIGIVTGGSLSQVFQALLIGPILSLAGGKKICSMLVETNQGLDFMTTLIESGAVKPVIDRCYPLARAAEAFRYYGEGHTRGKVIVTIGG